MQPKNRMRENRTSGSVWGAPGNGRSYHEIPRKNQHWGCKVTKSFSKTRCAHCLKYYDVLTSDHVFPKSWCPETTPEGLEKWQMPACNDCNKKIGKIENELLLKFGMCLPPLAPSSLGVAQKAMRSVSPHFARNNYDAEHRKKRKEKLLRETIDPMSVPLSSILPGFGFHAGQDHRQEIAITVPEADLKAIAVKIIRGVTWAIDEKYIEPDYEIKIYFARDPKLHPFYEYLRKFGKIYSLEPGLTVVRAIAEEDSMSGLYYIEIWQHVFFFGSVAKTKKVTESILV